jgi:serine/threonine protein kinase
MNGIITLTDNICVKILSDDDFAHYSKLFANDYVRMHHPKVFSLQTYDNTNVLIMEKKGIPLRECDNSIIQDAYPFIYEYLNELHKNDLYHGDLVRLGGCGIHLDNILYDERDEVYYIIDFNTKSSLELEIEILKQSKTYCKSVVRVKNKSNNIRKRKINTIDTIKMRVLAFED